MASSVYSEVTSVSAYGYERDRVLDKLQIASNDLPYNVDDITIFILFGKGFIDNDCHVFLPIITIFPVVIVLNLFRSDFIYQDSLFLYPIPFLLS